MAKKYIVDLSKEEKQQLLSTLRQVCFFAGFSDQQLQWLSKQGKEVWLNPRDFLFVEGDPAKDFYILLEGELQITKCINGQEVALINYPRCIFTGEIPLLSTTPHIVSARALHESYLLRFETEVFWMILCKCYPKVSFIFCIITIFFGIINLRQQYLSYFKSVAQKT